jgi:hypothetical protein
MARKRIERGARNLKKGGKTTKKTVKKIVSRKRATTKKTSGMLASAKSRVQQAVFAVVEGALDVTAKALGARNKKKRSRKS